MPSSSSTSRAPTASLTADAPVRGLSGVGPKLVERLEGLGIRSVGDVLLHRPIRYEDRSRITPVAELLPGQAALAVVRIEHAEVRMGQRRSLRVSARDGDDWLALRFFHFGSQQQARLAPGTWVRVFGEPRLAGYQLEIVHPECEVVADAAEGYAITPALLPVYPTVSGVSQSRLRDMVTQTLALIGRADFWPEILPEALTGPALSMTAAEAVARIHQPPPDVDVAALMAGEDPAYRRLAFEELLGHQLGLRSRRRQIRSDRAPAMRDAGRGLGPLFEGLGFAPTGAQRRVIGEILADMAAESPMLRLVQGDVGSGKTVVAAAALLTAVDNGWQGAFMAPTELLAEQHHGALSRWLEPLGIAVWLVTGKRKREAAALTAIADGRPGVIVGTHALFQESLAFGALGLAVIDEQHRFGVDQRLALRNKAARRGRRATTAHQLIMTATPIPRTLAMSAYADLDTSVIDELPPGRTPIQTVAIPNTRRDEVVARIGRAVAEGRQVYWVCTLIEASEKLEAQAAEAAAEALADSLDNVRVSLVHGRMKATDKARAMNAFKAGEIDVLVATTVIEVGVDVPNASLMIIENAERLGLAQLHQLRGRVGRGSVASHCVLLYQGPLSDTARARLSALRGTSDGFEIARADLELRGPGEVLGTRQTGAASFRIADLVRDADLAEAALAVADDVLAYHPREAEALIARWTASGDDYARV
ncbi:ATP-dependent DNA helicase RecG [Salinisphaera sp. Q1T1-3]|uniref:ATP-dependent DNA helicase RecG n=1 Tax=Salinisphaera sp. Q1T1-3 TaxID=2321229 RepID=UPI000E72771B|nr:ATP-dependent DNA helicase RecG [Salinisphaera sp. Q1T1-3]RJS94324.1 ATP-dependent DNA helicase RecG [Salinisphaera sp. Q1T1-3]